MDDVKCDAYIIKLSIQAAPVVMTFLKICTKI